LFCALCGIKIRSSKFTVLQSYARNISITKAKLVYICQGGRCKKGSSQLQCRCQSGTTVHMARISRVRETEVILSFLFVPNDSTSTATPVTKKVTIQD